MKIYTPRDLEGKLVFYMNSQALGILDEETAEIIFHNPDDVEIVNMCKSKFATEAIEIIKPRQVAE